MSRFVVEFGKDGTPPPVEGRLDAPAFHRNHAPIWEAIGPHLSALEGSCSRSAAAPDSTR